ncbi:MAG TPA: class I SAM-dependent methyltransferase [Bryobacteraceae bacterium]|nr:class I SAM-dependent methyltransferase [Bryobacteraceae bacterium]
MFELARTVRRFGLPYMLRLQKTYRAGWDEMIRGHLETSTMHALLNVGLIDEMQKQPRVDIGEFAARANLEIKVLQPLCEAFYSLGLFERDGAAYSLSEKGRNVAEVLRGWLDVCYGYSEVFHSLEPLLRKQMVYGRDLYRRPDYVARGSGEMEQQLFFPMVNDILSARGFRCVLDLGCGDGTFLRHLCAQNPDIRCFGIDLAPAAVEEGNRALREAGLQNRISLRALDISKIDQVSSDLQEIEAATVFFVLHELLYFGEDVLLDFLKSFRRLFPGRPLIAFEAVRPPAEELRRNPGIAIYYFLYHDLTQQKPVDAATWTQLFRAAGFASIEERHLDFARAAIYILN